MIDPARPDLTLRRAVWAQGRCTSLRHVIFDIAEEMGAVDIDAARRRAGQRVGAGGNHGAVRGGLWRPRHL
ncbi:hypothetical protein ACFC0S_28630 [Streptomyces sp. NPDC056084]|uniref:hypothetical protein n=1 Tax=unclassified Streptomyces TaxID=2593676 RepID=UPI0035D56864